jgi:beta-lactam-binding protein with PASTA domain
MEEAVVPDVVGLTVPRAREIGHRLGLVVVSDDPDGRPLGAQTWPGVWIVTAQHPEPGSRVPRGSTIVIIFEDGSGGGAGDREPRQPLPPLDALSGERDPAEDAA